VQYTALHRIFWLGLSGILGALAVKCHGAKGTEIEGQGLGL